MVEAARGASNRGPARSELSRRGAARHAEALKRHDERIRCYAIANGSRRAQPAKDARVNDHTQHHDDDVQV